MFLALYLIVTGFLVGIFSGLLGVGGGILMVPALTFIPPLFNVPAYGIHEATGMSAVQCLIGGMSGMITHAKNQAVRLPLLMPFILGAITGGFVGGYTSAWMDAFWIYGLFGLVLAVMLLIGLTFKPKSLPEADAINNPPSVWMGMSVGSIIGFIAANTGVGGSAMLMPFLIYCYRIPTRLAIGTGAGFVVVTSISASLGKWLGHQIPWPDVLWILASAWVGGILGAKLSHKTSTRFLKNLLLAVMALALIRVVQEMIILKTGTP